MFMVSERASFAPTFLIVITLRVRSLTASLAEFLAHVLMEKQHKSYLGDYT